MATTRRKYGAFNYLNRSINEVLVVLGTTSLNSAAYASVSAGYMPDMSVKSYFSFAILSSLQSAQHYRTARRR